MIKSGQLLSSNNENILKNLSKLISIIIKYFNIDSQNIFEEFLDMKTKISIKISLFISKYK